MALERWLTERGASIERLARAHAAMGEVEGPGRPLELGRPLAHAYIIRVVAEFQGFARDVYDLAVEHLVKVAAPREDLVILLTTAIKRGRQMDAGNATLTALRSDFGRLGVRNLEGKLAARYPQWDRDKGGIDPVRYGALIDVRNALAHGNQQQIDELRRQGRLDTLTWGRKQLAVLNRAARGLDRTVWEQMLERTRRPPW